MGSSRRWSLVTVLVVCVSLVGSAPAWASRLPKAGVADQKQLVTWLLGSSANPVLRSGFCGEVVHGVFLLNATGPGHSSASCQVKEGTAVVGLVGGETGQGVTPAAAIADRGPEDLAAGGVADPSARLDGDPIPFLLATVDPYRLKVNPGSFLEPIWGTGRIWAASRGWTVHLTNLPRGRHTLILADKLNGAPAVFTYKITVK